MNELKKFFDTELAKHAEYGSIEDINDKMEGYSRTVRILTDAYNKQFQDVNTNDLIEELKKEYSLITDQNVLANLSQQIEIMKVLFNGSIRLVTDGKKNYELIIHNYRAEIHRLREIKSKMYDDDVYQLLLILSNSIIDDEVVLNYKFSTTEIESIYDLLNNAPVSDQSKVEYTKKLVDVVKKQVFMRQEITIRNEETEQAIVTEEVTQPVQEPEKKKKPIVIDKVFYDMVDYLKDMIEKIEGDTDTDIVSWYLNKETPIDWDTRYNCYKRTTIGNRSEKPDLNIVLYDLICLIDPNDVINKIKNNELTLDEIKKYKKIYTNIIKLYKEYLNENNLPDEVLLARSRKNEPEQAQAVEPTEINKPILPVTPERIIHNIEEYFTEEQKNTVDYIKSIKGTLLEMLERVCPNKSYESLINLWNTGQKNYIIVPEIIGKILFVDLPKFDEQYNFCVFTNNERDNIDENWEEQLQVEINELFKNPGITDRIINEYELYLENLEEENRKRREEEARRQDEETTRHEEHQQLVSSNPQYNLIIALNPSIDEEENIVSDVKNMIDEFGNVVTVDSSFESIKKMEKLENIHTKSCNVKGDWEDTKYNPKRVKDGNYRLTYITIPLNKDNKAELIERYNIDPEKAPRFRLVLLTNIGYKPNASGEIYDETNHRIYVTKQRIDYIRNIFENKFNDITRQEAFDLIDNGSPEIVLGKTPRI